LSGDELECLSSEYRVLLDCDVIRFRNDPSPIDFSETEILGQIFEETSKIKNRRKRRPSRRTPEKTIAPERPIDDSESVKSLAPKISEMKLDTTPKSKSRPIRIKLDLSSEKPPESPSPRSFNWAEKKIQSPGTSLKDIIEEEKNSKTSKMKPVGKFTPGRRKKAKPQDIVRAEIEETINIAKSSPKSPWGNARPVKTAFPEESVDQPKNEISEDFPDLRTQTFETSQNYQVRFKDIIEKQAAAENNRKQRVEKSLEAIEIEERAIQELRQYYETMFPGDMISVTRVNRDIANPRWSAKT